MVGQRGNRWLYGSPGCIFSNTSSSRRPSDTVTRQFNWLSPRTPTVHPQSHVRLPIPTYWTQVRSADPFCKCTARGEQYYRRTIAES